MHHGRQVHGSALIDQALDKGLDRLRFARPLEDRFLADQSEQRLRLMRRATWLAALFAAGLVAVDTVLVPDRLAWSLWLRIGVFVPVCVVGMAIVARWATPWLREWMLASAGLFAAILSLAVALPSQSPHVVDSLVSLTVVVFVTSITRFWPSLVMCVGVVVAQVVGLGWMGLLDGAMGMSSTMLLISCVLFTLYGAYALERDQRRAYLMSLQEEELQQALRQANEAVAQTARSDALTQVSNRRHLDEVLAQVWAHSQAQQTSLGLLLLDVDQFKAYNDLYGHLAGDAALQAVAQCMSSCLRKGGDVVARWGGEEFAVVMSGASLDAAQMLAERIRQAVEGRALLHAGSCCASVVTVSIGVAAMTPGPQSSLAELIGMADRCLYEAKSRGRNRVWARLADPDVSSEALVA
jgi:diguanylate cyclase (GGDEF)-like protein